MIFIVKFRYALIALHNGADRSGSGAEAFMLA